jgi:hypothetical protein
MKYVCDGDGNPANPDDMPPNVRALVMLIEHIHTRREAGLSLPCDCHTCQHYRAALKGVPIMSYEQALAEHADQRRSKGLPLPCPCRECRELRDTPCPQCDGNFEIDADGLITAANPHRPICSWYADYVERRGGSR